MDFIESLKFFIQPKKVIKETMNHPSMLISLVLVLLPWLFYLVISAIIGFQINSLMLINLGVSAIISIVVWLISSAFLYLILFLLKGKKTSKSFASIASLLSLLETSTLAILILILIGLFMLPGINQITSQYSLMINNQITFDEFLVNSNTALNSIGTNTNIVGLLIIMLLAAIILLNYFYCFSIILKELFEISNLRALFSSLGLIIIGTIIPVIKFGGINLLFSTFLNIIFFVWTIH